MSVIHGKSAIGVGDEAAAKEYFAELIAVAGDAKQTRASLREACAYFK